MFDPPDISYFSVRPIHLVSLPSQIMLWGNILIGRAAWRQQLLCRANYHLQVYTEGDQQACWQRCWRLVDAFPERNRHDCDTGLWNPEAGIRTHSHHHPGNFRGLDCLRPHPPVPAVSLCCCWARLNPKVHVQVRYLCSYAHIRFHTSSTNEGLTIMEIEHRKTFFQDHGHRSTLSCLIFVP